MFFSGSAFLQQCGVDSQFFKSLFSSYTAGFCFQNICNHLEKLIFYVCVRHIYLSAI